MVSFMLTARFRELSLGTCQNQCYFFTSHINECGNDRLQETILYSQSSVEPQTELPTSLTMINTSTVRYWPKGFFYSALKVTYPLVLIHDSLTSDETLPDPVTSASLETIQLPTSTTTPDRAPDDIHALLPRLQLSHIN